MLCWPICPPAMASQSAGAGEDVNWPMEGVHDHTSIEAEELSKLQENSNSTSWSPVIFQA